MVTSFEASQSPCEILQTTTTTTYTQNRSLNGHTTHNRANGHDSCNSNETTRLPISTKKGTKIVEENSADGTSESNTTFGHTSTEV